MPSRDVPWVYDVRVPDNTIVENLKVLGIQARYGFKPVSHSQPFNIVNTDEKCFELSKQILYLPVLVDNESVISNSKQLTSLVYDNKLIY